MEAIPCELRSRSPLSTAIDPDQDYAVAMKRNRSVPADTLLSHVTYKNLESAIQWLDRAFGFKEHFRYGEAVSGAQLRAGSAWIMVRAGGPNYRTPAELGFGTQSLSVFVEDVEDRFAQARDAGAEILEEPHETEYGEFQFVARDLEGHHWLFARHASDRSPAEWGATVRHSLEELVG